MNPTTIAAVTGLIVALASLVTTIATLVQVVRGRTVSVTQHTELLAAAVAPRPVETHGDKVIVAPPEVPAA